MRHLFFKCGARLGKILTKLIGSAKSNVGFSESLDNTARSGLEKGIEPQQDPYDLISWRQVDDAGCGKANTEGGRRTQGYR